MDRQLRHVFTGHIAGVGTAARVRLVVGHWQDSPFGSFTDVMVQQPDGRRVLLAPDDAVADFVASTYHFDRVETGPVTATLDPDRLTVRTAVLDLDVGLGGPAPLDRVLRLVPARLATAPRWLRAIDPVASRLVRGVHTAGTAGNGRREYYGVRRSRLIVSAAGRYRGTDLGALRPLSPPVAFGFASAPARPQLVAVTTTIDDAG
ncbi:hypothetical protein [Mycobacterium sp. GA-2829]|uniref:hypothetical protein n=1 Tax=Mycobacterium sp. GA-2829 TaxID=1772283 RepID=UPI001E2918CC|nr:hypothetical protein [Mycobacterium sp. GA-2829]